MNNKTNTQTEEKNIWNKHNENNVDQNGVFTLILKHSFHNVFINTVKTKFSNYFQQHG